MLPLATNLPDVAFGWRPDSRRVLLALSNGVALVDVSHIAPGALFPDTRFPLPTRPTALTFRADGQWFAVADANGGVRILETESAQVVSDLPRQVAAAELVAFSADGRRLATMHTNRESILWAVPSGEVIARFADPNDASVSTWGRAFFCSPPPSPPPWKEKHIPLYPLT